MLPIRALFHGAASAPSLAARRNLSNFKKRARARFLQPAEVVQEQTSYPDFALILRQLYRRGHPDLLRHSHPDFAKVNDSSMQVLNSVVSTIKIPNQFPPRIVEDIPFYLKNAHSGEYEEHVLQIRTAGGECKKQLTTAFQTFFAATSLSEGGNFVWNKEYFPILDADHVEEKDEA